MRYGFLLLLLSCLFIPNGCGFRPIYSAPSLEGEKSVDENLSRVSIANIPDREGQFLRNRLIDRFYTDRRPVDPAYHLLIDPVREVKTDLDITKSSDATRAQLRVISTITLLDVLKEEPLLRRELTAITSYNILNSQFTTLVSEDNARKNALADLARQIESQISLYFQRSR